MKRQRVNVGAGIRRIRALRVALGARRWRFRALDCRKGRPSCSVPRIAASESEVLQRCHTWLRFNRPNASAWWFFVEELAFDASGRYSVVVSKKDVLVYADTLWDGYREPFFCDSRRKEVACG